MKRARRDLAALAALLLSLGPAGARAQVSPGPLATAHESLDGATQCLRCHEQGAGKAGMDRRCLDCHAEVRWMRERSRGFHAQVSGQACATCHPDHGGRAFALIAWDGGAPERFDHARAGFTLLGKHASIACRDCHKPALQKSGAVALLQVKDHAKSWFGLETACVSCHEDPHRGSLGAECVSCHSQEHWKPAPGFDHQKTGYPLTGAHTKPACAACHATAAVNAGQDARGALLPRWKPVPHADCVSCHRDPHAGRFTGECARCHVTRDWRAVNSKGFDHDQTRYPLRGAHVRVGCDACHAAARGGRRPKFARCMDCHADAHRGQATIAKQPADCATCHDVRGFTPSIWPRLGHQKTAYPLEGAHVTASCAGCHTRAAAGSAEAAALGRSRVRMRPGHAACTDCHQDPHKGRFAAGGARPHAAGCLACHSLAAFRPSTYDGRAHADCAFPLEGAHRSVPCQQCHKELDRPGGGSTLGSAPTLVALRFDSRARACRDCHTDAHGGQFAARRDKGACESCHGFAAFVPADRFDHDRDASFHLQGAHARTPCGACHRVAKAAGSNARVVIYRPTPSRCESCHAAATADSAGSGAPGRSGRGTSRRVLLRSTSGR